MQMPSSLVALLMLAVLVGTVTDRTTGQPMPNVTVAVGAVHATSRPDGTYRLSGVKTGKATVTASSNDAPPQRFPVTIGSATTHLDLVLCSVTLDYNCGGLQ
jgi:hypothetical protein